MEDDEKKILIKNLKKRLKKADRYIKRFVKRKKKDLWNEDSDIAEGVFYGATEIKKVLNKLLRNAKTQSSDWLDSVIVCLEEIWKIDD